MASITKIGDRWRAQIRRKGHPSIAQTFDKKAQAQEWARRVETEISSGEFSDARKLADFTIEGLVNRYIEEVGAIKAFGKSKLGALDMLKRFMGSVTLASLTDTAIVDYAKKRHAKGAGGVTIGIELTYLGTVLKLARALWKIPFREDPIEEARPSLRHIGLVKKSQERDRRPTPAEIKSLVDYFTAKKRQRIPMPDIIPFAIATTMRAGEITSLRVEDLNEEDRTIVIRDRKHPQEKLGNNQTVPLLGEAFDIVKRQPKSADGRIFPYNEATISSIFPRACTELKIPDLHFHDLRHEGISRLFEQGYRIEQVALVSGHRDWKMLKRYTQVKAKDLHRD